MERIGVFVCHCGTNIAGTVDVERVAQELSKVDGVVYSTHYTYMCSSQGQQMIEEHIKNDSLTGVVLCSCSPRMHEKTFRACAERAGLNAYKVEVANIREQDSWVMKDKEKATEKAIALGKAAIAKSILDTPLTPGTTPVTKRALVIGGGIAGMTAALDIADAGFPVDIVEKTYSIGGKMAMLDKTFPTLDCASCIVTPKMTEVSQNPNIRVLSYSEVCGVKGYIGNFSIDIKRHPRYVDETKCTGCGACIEKCPNAKVPNAFNCNLNNCKAINIPFAQAVPKVAGINAEYCLHMKGLSNGRDNVCGMCEKACGAGAIDFNQKEEIITEKYGAIIVATGYNPIALDKFDEYAYNTSPDVVSSLEFERLCNASGPTNGHLLRPSDGKEPKKIVFVQCVGSRCSAESTKGHEYCSKICCMYTAKHAMLTRDHYPDTECYVFYIDVRTPGKNFDEFYRRAVEQYGVHYIKGQVGKVKPMPDGTLEVIGSDLILNRQVKINADMVVLAASIEADKTARPLATMLTTSMDTNDFFLEAHTKLRPVESPTAGIFLAGCCQGPKDIPETVAQSSGAAAKAICLLVKDELKNNPCTAHPDENACNGCGQCENVCPYGAISYIEKDFRGPNRTTVKRRVSQVNTAMCQGCGACTVACPSGAMDLNGFSNKQIMAEVDACL
ncbi:MAG: CoB--CoM heterodisulfide reductase iron-sulfur subunit A family protein [Treponema sp.]|uniref:CoB--CoM heterodisulfide reductase iron-sulfur subunit A family protein n=1 Tax=Treponema sp. TaxID=166 RepID=UPI00298DF87B|nr:CoB--CoM heterodisulfide reductase iron-sulfur subunit A family protein [Treponema sp.]MBR5934107.1 CoB--CoM heterodisulfide reductase iron-sulfur subunit A family protein [Treponema sp.]